MEKLKLKEGIFVEDKTPSGFIEDIYGITKFAYLLMFKMPYIDLRNISCKFYKLLEAYYTDSYRPDEMNKLYNKISYYNAKVKSNIKKEYDITDYIGVYRVIKSTDRFIFRDVTLEMMALASENDKYEICKGIKDPNTAKSNYT